MNDERSLGMRRWMMMMMMMMNSISLQFKHVSVVVTAPSRGRSDHDRGGTFSTKHQTETSGGTVHFLFPTRQLQPDDKVPLISSWFWLFWLFLRVT